MEHLNSNGIQTGIHYPTPIHLQEAYSFLNYKKGSFPVAEKYADEIFLAEKGGVEKILLRRLHRDDSPFVQVEIMETLCRLDRYRYFRSMIPGLIQKLDHYNSTVNEIAFAGLEQLLSGSNSHNSREARIVFNTLRQVLFLMRKRLAGVKEPNLLLKQKLQLLRWSLKILGTQEIQRLPKEVISLL